MKKNILFVFLCLAFSFSFAAVAPVTQVCNFDGDNQDRVYTIRTIPGVGTTFRLPDGWEIQDFVVTDSKSFYGQSNGVIGTVKPLEPGKDTSVVIYTTNGKLFTFHLNSSPSEEVDVLVVIDIHDQTFFNQKIRIKAEQMASEKTAHLKMEFQTKNAKSIQENKEKMLFSTNTEYAVKDNHFKIKKTVDDGVFTYLLLPEAQERPAVFVHPHGKKKEKEFQPVKYVDNGNYYTIHKVLSGREKFFLKYGDKITEIQRN